MERRILLHVSTHDGPLAQRVLQSAGLDAVVCETVGDVATELEHGVGALLVAEEALGDMLLAELGRYLAAQPPWSDLPVLVMAKRGADSLEAQRAIEHLGNVMMLERPVRTLSLITAARSALRARARQYEMRALSRRKDEFLATLAHELRNPLAPISNATAILQRLHPSPQVTSLVGMVDRQVNHLTRLVDDLLDVARITSGKLELKLAPTTAHHVTAHALEIAQATLDARQHKVDVSEPGDDVPLMADHVRLVQAIANLLVNAAKFTPHGGQVVLEVREDAGDVVFTVRDTGRGLAASDLERIFEMFEQTRVIGEPSGGLGLGLHLTRAFAQLHGGSVRASSAGPGQGSTFELRVPAARDRAPMAASTQQAAAAPGTGRRVLVVDDNIDAAETLEALLSMHGLAVSVAHDGAAAVRKVEAERPDAVVMDIGMPVMNGYDAARHIRSRLDGKQPMLIALTGWGQYADKERAAAAGFDVHFVKPLHIEDLLGCLARL
ncbi:hybrid sensor histidine kinase/response regulator [Ramlibacter algicola]|uniref:histidine kinase n=1 Tax=Ramlibacter algicola TaxID=2795217 RepID=A0A934UTG7_9BURK|nr:ATP-binding protein [Ramlibacter algicola]MBK0394931.1 response regulator [Ramlibacter algicola]